MNVNSPTPEMREQFEKWACIKYPASKFLGQLEHEGDNYSHPLVQQLWEAWQAAVREAVLELAPYLEHKANCMVGLKWGEEIAPCGCGLSALRQKYGVGE